MPPPQLPDLPNPGGGTITNNGLSITGGDGIARPRDVGVNHSDVWNDPGAYMPGAGSRINPIAPYGMAKGPNGEALGTGGMWVYDPNSPDSATSYGGWKWQVNAKYAADQALAKTPPNPSLGDQYTTNQSYTPFGLQPSATNTGQYGLPGAFGGNYGSDLLVPQLEQRRMQRIIQAYPQGGG